MRRTLILNVMLVTGCLCFAQWEQQESGTEAQLRGISAVSSRVAWASGTKGTVLRTVDSGKHWARVGVDGAEALDFRDIQAFDEKTAFALSAGPGEQSRIYKTADGGAHWQLQFTNREPKAFYDCFAFWDRKHGIALSDSVEGSFLQLKTEDGKHWQPLHPRQLPAALPDEGAFAASGTCLITLGKSDAWFATGGPAARVFHSGDRGQTWTVSITPVRSGAASQGIFSLAFSDSKSGVAVGGDYKDPAGTADNAAITNDGGRSWAPAAKNPSGYRSAVAVVPGPSPTLIAVGTTGSDYSMDGGRTWQALDAGEYNAVSFAGPDAGWAVGPKGKIAHFTKIPERP
ncbi:MAG TPA: YCF48-related protein [Candidatus Angelobacter sp.]